MQDFDIIEGLDNMQMDAVMALLKTTHWASKRPEQQERLAMEHSFCYGARCRKTGRQIGIEYVIFTNPYGILMQSDGAQACIAARREKERQI